MTAVEWLMEQITFDSDGERWASYKECCDLKEYFQQALEIEKLQLEKEFERGFTKCADTLQFILDKGLTNNYKNETHDYRSGKPTI